MKNFYKLLNGKKVTSGNGAINIASSPLDSSGTIVFIDGTKLDFLGGLSIESSRTNYIGRSNENGIFSVKDPFHINAKYFPIIGFGSGDNTTNISNTIFNFENLSNIKLNDDNYNQGKKIFSHTIKFKNLQLKDTLHTFGNSVFKNNVSIEASTNVNDITNLGGKISVLENGMSLGTDPNIDSTYQYIFNVITGNFKINSNLTSNKFTLGKPLTVSNGGATITGKSNITGKLEVSNKIIERNGIDIVGETTITGKSIFHNKLNITNTIYGKDSANITQNAYFRKKDKSKFTLESNSNFKTRNSQNNPNALNITGNSYFERTTVTEDLSIDNNGSLETKKLTVSNSIPVLALDVTGQTNTLNTLEVIKNIFTNNNPITISGQDSTISLNKVSIREFSNEDNNSICVGSPEKPAEIVFGTLTANNISNFTENVSLSNKVNLKLTGSDSEITTTIKDNAYLYGNVVLDTDGNDDINTTLTIDNSLSTTAIVFGPKGSAVINGDTEIEDLISSNKLIVENGGIEISGDSEINGMLSDISKTGNKLTVSSDTSSETLEIKSTSVFTSNITIGDETKQNTGELEVSGNSLLKAKLDVTEDTEISGATITGSNKLTASGGLEVLSGDTTFKDPLKSNTLEISETTDSKKFKVTAGGIVITGNSKSGSLLSSNYDTEVSASSTIESILDIGSKYPSLSTGSLGSNAIKTKLSTNTLEVTGTSTFSDNISITGNLVADSISLTNAEIIATSPVIDSSWLEEIPTTAISPASTPSISVADISPTTYTTKNAANPTTYSKGSGSDATVSSTITVENNIKFTAMTINTAFNPTTLDETYTGTTGGSVTTDKSVTTSTLKLNEWTDNTNFLANKEAPNFRDTNDSNRSNLAWSSSDGYQLYAKVLDETKNSTVGKYILFAKKGSNGYEFIEEDMDGCCIDMDTTTTKIYLGGEFIEEEGSKMVQLMSPEVCIEDQDIVVHNPNDVTVNVYINSQYVGNLSGNTGEWYTFDRWNVDYTIQFRAEYYESSETVINPGPEPKSAETIVREFVPSISYSSSSGVSVTNYSTLRNELDSYGHTNTVVYVIPIIKYSKCHLRGKNSAKDNGLPSRPRDIENVGASRKTLPGTYKSQLNRREYGRKQITSSSEYFYKDALSVEVSPFWHRRYGGRQSGAFNGYAHPIKKIYFIVGILNGNGAGNCIFNDYHLSEMSTSYIRIETNESGTTRNIASDL